MPQPIATMTRYYIRHGGLLCHLAPFGALETWGKPTAFATREKAEAAITRTLESLEYQVWDRSDFEIVEKEETR